MDKSIQRIREANQEKDIVRLMTERGISRHKAKQILSMDFSENSSLIADKSLKSTDVSAMNDRKSKNPSKTSLNASKKSQESLNISTENKSNKVSKEIDYNDFVRNRELDEFGNVRDSLKNLEDHLVEFCKDKSSKNSTPHKEEEKLDIKPENYPVKEQIFACENLESKFNKE